MIGVIAPATYSRAARYVLRAIDVAVVGWAAVVWWAYLGDRLPGQLVIREVPRGKDGAFEINVPFGGPPVPLWDTLVVVVPAPRDGCDEASKYVAPPVIHLGVDLEVCDRFGCRGVEEARVATGLPGVCRARWYSPRNWTGESRLLTGVGPHALSGRVTVAESSVTSVGVAVTRGVYYQRKRLAEQLSKTLVPTCMLLGWLALRVLTRLRLRPTALRVSDTNREGPGDSGSTR